MRRVKAPAADASVRRGRPSDSSKHVAILAGARKLFTRFGFDHTSMDAIADCAAVTKTTVYKHFGNKQALFETVLESLLEELPTPADMISKPHGPLPQRLREIAGNASQLAVSPLMRGIGRLLAFPMASASLRQRQFWRACLEPYQRELADRLQDEARAGRLLIPDATIASSQFLNMVASEPFIRMLVCERAIDTKNSEARLDAAVWAFLRAHSKP